MKELNYLLIIFSIFILINSIHAQERMKASIDECISIGLKNSKPLHSSSMNIEAAEARFSYAKTSRLPSLKLASSYARLSDIPPFEISVPTPAGTQKFVISQTILNNYQSRLVFQQPVFTGFMMKNNIHITENSLFAAQKDYSKDKNELIYKVKEAYWNLFKAQEFKKVIDQNVEQMESHLRDVKNFYDQGLTTQNQVLQVQVQLSNAKLTQIDVSNNVRLAMVNLNNIIEIPLETEIEITTIIQKPTGILSNLNELVEKAHRNRPEIQSMEYRVQAVKSSVAIANSSRYPQIYLMGSYYYNRPNTRIMPVKDKFTDTWDVALSVQWDLWNWGMTGTKVEEAKAAMAQIEDGLDITKNGIVLEVTSDYLTLKKTKESISVTEDGVKQAEENYKVTREKFKEGMALNTDLLDAEVALLQAKINYTQTLVNYELSAAKLQKSTGGE